MKEIQIFRSLFKVAGSFGLFPPLGVLAMTSGGAYTASLLGHAALFVYAAIVIVVLLIVTGIVLIARELRNGGRMWRPAPAKPAPTAKPAPAAISGPVLEGVVLQRPPTAMELNR